MKELRTRKQGKPWSVAVVGAGIVGLAAAKALLDRGVEVDVFEHDAPGGAQSRGRSRLLTRDSEDPRLMDLVEESRQLWREWERKTGNGLLSQQGLISFDSLSVPDDSRIREELPGGGLNDLADEDIEAHLPILADPVGPATLDRHGGAIWARVAIGTLIDWVGGYIVPRKVDRLEPLADGRVRVHAGDIRRTHDSVIVAAGFGTGEFAAGLGVDIPIDKRAKVLTTHAIQPRFSGRDLPGFRGLEAGNEVAYGMPIRTRDMYKIGFYRDLEADGDGRIDPEAVAELAAEVEDWVREEVPGLVPDRLATFADWSIELPWGMDAVGIWRSGPVLLPVGMKMFGLAPVLGQVLAEAAEGNPIREEFWPDQLLGDPQPGF